MPAHLVSWRVELRAGLEAGSHEALSFLVLLPQHLATRVCVHGGHLSAPRVHLDKVLKAPHLRIGLAHTGAADTHHLLHVCARPHACGAGV
jgi:hypothetical protein